MRILKARKGFTGIDISIAIVIVVITVGISVAMVGRISNQVREIELDTVVTGKITQEINEIQKRKAQGETLSGKVKTLTVENQIYDIEVEGDKILIKKTVGGQKIVYKEASTQRTTSSGTNTSIEEGRLANVVDMFDYDYVNGRKKVNLAIIESYYEGQGTNKKLHFRKKTSNLLEKDKLFGNDLPVFLATGEENFEQDGRVKDPKQVRFWVPRIAEKRNVNPDISKYKYYVQKKLWGEPVDTTMVYNMPNLNDVYKQGVYDETSNKSYVYLNKENKIEIGNGTSEYIYLSYGMITNNDLEYMDKESSPKGFWYKIRHDATLPFDLSLQAIVDILTKDLIARKPNLGQAITEGNINVSDALKMIKYNSLIADI